MINKEKTIWIIAVIAIIIITTIVIFMVIKGSRTVETVNSNTLQNENVENEVEEVKNEINMIENNVLLEENNVKQEDTTSTETKQEQTSTEEITREEVETIKSNDEKAIEIAKKDWGKDSKVVFVNDGMSKSTGRYIVAVRDATTRNAICYYHIDVNTGEFKVEN